MRRNERLQYYLAASIALATFLLYLPALRNDFVIWDDPSYVSENLHIRSWNPALFKWAFFSFYESNWHPLTWLSHAVDFSVWGTNPLGHHLTNIILHAVNTFLVVLLVAGLLDAYRKTSAGQANRALPDGGELIAAATTGLLFGLHPIHVESVAWISERKDLLCGLFFLLGIIAYSTYASSRQSAVGSRQLEGNETTGWGRKNTLTNRYYLLTLGFFILALMSKPMAITLPAVLLILDWFPFSRIRSGRTFWAACVEKLPFLVLSLVSSIITVLAQKSGGAVRSFEFAPFSTRVLVAAKSLIGYLGKMLLPLNLVPFYPYPDSASLLSAEYLFPIVLAVALTAASVLIARKSKVFLSAWGYYVVTLLPVLGIVQVGFQSMADRYMYLPSLGPFLIVGLLAAWISGKVNHLSSGRLTMKIASAVSALVILASISYLTFRQIGVWENSIVLWTYVIEKEPKAYQAYVNRGMAFEKIGRADRALADYDTAIAVNPDNYAPYVNRGVLRGEAGMFDSAMRDFNQAIALNPDYADAFSNRGIVYALTGRYDQAFEDFNKALALKHDHADAYFNRGRLYAKEGRPELAREDYQKACDLGHERACDALHGM